MFSSPIAITCVLCSVVAIVCGLSRVAKLELLFRFIPALLWIYVLPIAASSLGVIPTESPVYKEISRIILPSGLVIYLLGTDLESIKALGRQSLIIVVLGACSVMISGIITFLIFSPWLGSDIWRSTATLTSGWVGGYTTLLVVKESVEFNDNDFASLLLAASVLTYAWIGVLSGFARMQSTVDRWNGVVDRSSLDHRANDNGGASFENEQSGSLTVAEFAMWIAVAMSLGHGVFWVAGYLPAFPPALSTTAIGFLLLLVVGLAASLQKQIRASFQRATPIANYCLLIQIAGIGAQCQFQDFAGTGWMFAFGAVVLILHAILMLIAARLLRAPLHLIATASQANIGGFASAPVVAAAYRPGSETIAIMMSIVTSQLGIPFGLLAAYVFDWILK